MNKTICTTCPYCGTGCGVLATLNGAGGLSVAGDPAHPANFGRLCSKGSALGETVSLDGRVLTPQVSGRPASWDHALDLVAQKFKTTIAEHGPDAVAFYVSGQLLTEDYYVANKLMKGFIGSGNIDTNSRLCMASTVAGHKRAFGTDTVPGTYEDLELADLIVLTGSNLAWCHPVLYQRIVAAKASRPGLKVVVIDPRRTATCDLADLHLPIKPGTDVALFNHLLTQTQILGAVDRAYVTECVSNFSKTLDAADRSDVSVTGLDRFAISKFVKLWIENPKAVTVFSQGVNQSDHGADKVNAILNCHLATGRIGKPGCGPFSVTGQPNAMGGREVGGLANMLACHLDIETPEHRDTVQEFWQSPKIAKQPGLKAVDMFQAISDGKIKALWVMCTNPAVSMPNASDVRKALEACEFVAVSDMFASTDTARLADVVFPATGWGEKDGTVTNSDRTISRQRALVRAPGNARHDWTIICEIATRMGFANHFAYRNPAEIFREHAKLSGLAAKLGKDFDISGLAALTNHEYDTLAPTRWPFPIEGTPKERMFADGKFTTPTGRANMLAVSQPEEETPFTAGTLRLNTGRARDQWHTMTRTARAPRLNQHYGEPYLEIHPEDATRFGLEPADIALIENDHGSALLRTLITERVAKGNAFAPIHWTAETASRARVSDVVPAITDPVSGQPDSKSARIKVCRFPAAWFGFGISKERPAPAADYWATSKSKDGWQIELAGRELPPNWETFARDLLHTPEADCTSIIDPNGTVRFAFHKEDKLVAALFVEPRPVRLSRSFVSRKMNSSSRHILAGHPGENQTDPGATICACFNIGVNTILSAIQSQDLQTVEAIGEALSAGTNCGSCRPELAGLLVQSKPHIAAE